MPMPLWFGHVNKRLFNPLALRTGKRPVITHVGRSSGKQYRTPLDANPVDGGYIFILVYGSGSQWVRNIMASGTARLEVDGKQIELETPRLVNKGAASQLLPSSTKMPPKFFRINEYLQMDTCD